MQVTNKVTSYSLYCQICLVAFPSIINYMCMITILNTEYKATVNL